MLVYSHICANCGRSFETTNRQARTCRVRCRVQLHRKEARERLEKQSQTYDPLPSTPRFYSRNKDSFDIERERRAKLFADGKPPVEDIDYPDLPACLVRR